MSTNISSTYVYDITYFISYYMDASLSIMVRSRMNEIRVWSHWLHDKIIACYILQLLKCSTLIHLTVEAMNMQGEKKCYHDIIYGSNLYLEIWYHTTPEIHSTDILFCKCCLPTNFSIFFLECFIQIKLMFLTVFNIILW